MAIATHGLEQTGLSVDIHVTYISAAREGEFLTIEGKTGKVGRTMAFTTVTIYKGEDDNKAIVAQGTHTKHLGYSTPRN